MVFLPTEIDGVWIVDAEPRTDARGVFARVWCEEEFAARGLETRLVQANTAFNHRRGTVRGMHYQHAPADEVKLVRCTQGALFDVALDLRPGSPTYRRWVGAELSAGNRRMLYIPRGCAHGYQTLQDGTELWYGTSHAYVPSAATGVRHDDPAFGITWPEPVSIISDADAGWPYLQLTSS
jgi:dTDP-4-dehydrorhamnose 3,5-epimerase